MANNLMSNLYSIQGLHKSYMEGEKKIVVLLDLQLTIAEGERLAIVGESGVGKSTLLHILGTLDRPTSGQLIYRGRDLSLLRDDELAHFRNHEIGFVFQFHYLLPDFSALENVMLPALIRGWTWEKSHKSAEKLLEMVGLKDRAEHPPGKLSGGEQQRVAVARSMILEPKLIIADEPTGDLDSHTGGEIEKLLFQLNVERGVSLVVATHNWQFARRIGRQVELREGGLFPVQL